jgi:hypothetical protein
MMTPVAAMTRGQRTTALSLPEFAFLVLLALSPVILFVSYMKKHPAEKPRRGVIEGFIEEPVAQGMRPVRHQKR